jgi:hypothetical protein
MLFVLFIKSMGNLLSKKKEHQNNASHKDYDAMRHAARFLPLASIVCLPCAPI